MLFFFTYAESFDKSVFDCLAAHLVTVSFYVIVAI